MPKSESLSFLLDHPVIASSHALQIWQTQQPEHPAWVLVSPPYIPGLFLLQKAQFQNSALTTLSDAIAQLLLSLQSGCPLTLLRGMLALMPQAPALLEQLITSTLPNTRATGVALPEPTLPPLELPLPEPTPPSQHSHRCYLILLEDP